MSDNRSVLNPSNVLLGGTALLAMVGLGVSLNGGLATADRPADAGASAQASQVPMQGSVVVIVDPSGNPIATQYPDSSSQQTPSGTTASPSMSASASQTTAGSSSSQPSATKASTPAATHTVTAKPAQSGHTSQNHPARLDRATSGAGRDQSCYPNMPYRIVWGDTLSEISFDRGISMRKVALINEIKNVDLIYAGDTICLPTNR